MIVFKMNIAKLDPTLHFSGPWRCAPSENKGSGPTAGFILISCTPRRAGICIVVAVGLTFNLSSGDGERRHKGTTHRFCIIMPALNLNKLATGVCRHNKTHSSGSP